jgi:flagellar biosynthesis protein FlhG
MADSPKRRFLEGKVPDAENNAPEAESKSKNRNHRAPTLLAIGGGKGGLGASFFGTNAAVYLARMGHQVTLVDADLGAANLHSLLGVAPTSDATLSSFINREAENLESIKLPTKIPNVYLVSGATDPTNVAALKHVQRQRLVAHVNQIEADYTWLDVGSGMNANSLDLFLAAKLGVLVVTPEPTAIEVTYRFLRAAFFRRLTLLRWPPAIERRIFFLQDQATGLPGVTPRDLLTEMEQADPESAKVIAKELWRFRPAILVNQIRTRSDQDVGEAFRVACLRRFGIRVELLGNIEYDDNAWISVRRRKALLLDQEDSTASKQIIQAVHRVLTALSSIEQLPQEPPPRWLQSLDPQNHYDMLELEPGATDEEIRRAHKRARALFADDSVGLYGAYQHHEIERYQRRVVEASECLADVDKRRAYDLALFPEGHPGRSWIEEYKQRTLQKPAPVAPPKEKPPEPAPSPVTKAITKTLPILGSKPTPPQIPTPQSPEVEMSGAWLKSLRESRGIVLADIATKTRIQLSNLQLLEDEAFDKMAAPVYVRGFVFEYARYLRLDADRVSRGYVERYRAWLDAQAARAR